MAKKKTEEVVEEKVAPTVEEKPKKKATTKKAAAKKTTEPKKDTKTKEVKAEKPKKGTSKATDDPFEKFIKDEKILTGKVFSVGRNDPTFGEFVTIYGEGDRRIIIPKDELVGTQDSKMILSFIGMQIPFIPTSIDKENNRVIASRIKAQQKIISTEFTDADPEKVYTGTICGTMQFGVYVDVLGVQGVLKNKDYSNTNLAVIDNYEIGDKIEVKIKRIYSEGKKVEFKVPVFAINEELDFTKIAKDSVVKARVVKTLDHCFFARVLPGIDAKCKHPFEDEVEVGDYVLVLILENNVSEDNKLELKGKYIRHIINHSKKTHSTQQE